MTVPLKLSRHAFLRFWQAHSFAGIVGGLLLYVMCLCGTLTLYRGELEVWEEPLAQPSVAGSSLNRSLNSFLEAAGAIEPTFWIHLPRDGSSPKFEFRPQGSGRWLRYWVDSKTGAVVAERERLSGFIYQLHFLWHEATGVWLYYVAGLLAVSMLVALTSGFLIHLKDLVPKFHQFRPGSTARVMWSDLHKVLGVLGLPFQLTYAYTGALMVLGPVILQAFVGPVFGGNRARAEQLAFGVSEPTVAAPGPAATVLSLEELLARARGHRPHLQIEAVEVSDHGLASGRVAMWGFLPGVPEARAHIELAELDGRVLARSEADDNASDGLRRWVVGLHFARFGGRLLRPAFFALGILSCLALLSGNMIWLTRRERTRLRGLERLTAGIGAGSVTAVAALFFASRLLPLTISRRGAIEEGVFFATLVAAVGYALVVRDVRVLWWRLLAAAGVLLAPVPALAARLSESGLFGGGRSSAPLVCVDLAIQGLSLGLLLLAAALRRRLSVASHALGVPLPPEPQRG